ncbi:MAG: AbgT family transporter [Planctomycetota bacterium]|nr:AbgT family transporter [Planctomycetota bacterium]
MNTTPRRGMGERLLDAVEWVGNKLPDPVFLFLGCALLVMALSAVGASMGWEVQPVRPAIVTEPLLDASGAPLLDAQGAPQTRPVLDAKGAPVVELQSAGDPVRPRSLLSSEGLWWALQSMVSNFINFPPLGIVLAGMLGIGVAEKVGFFAAAMKWLALITPGKLLTPMIVFIGVMSNVASDAGYIVLPPLAAALYLALGRPPVVGIAAAFAGVSAGFSANLLISATDALMAGLTTAGARILDPNYTVNPTCNWYFLAASTFLLTLVGWAVTAWLVEPRLMKRVPEQGGPVPRSASELNQQRLSPGEQRGLMLALVAELAALAIVLALVLVPGWPLHGPVSDAPSAAPKWTQAVIPLIIFLFLAPALAYGWAVGEIRSQKDIAKAFTHAMAQMAPIIVLAFFAGQFIAYFRYSNLDQMLAFTGGKALVDAQLPPSLLLVGIVVLTATVNLFMGSMSAKWTMLSPILVPMLMMTGMSPELTQAAYRVGDSVTNVITPLNSYLVIILVALQRYNRSAGMGTLIATMLPYALVFGVLWTIFLVAWVALGLPLGPDTNLQYIPAG